MRARWRNWEFVDRLGIVVTAATGLALIGLTMCTACNSDGRNPAERILDFPAGSTLAPLNVQP